MLLGATLLESAHYLLGYLPGSIWIQSSKGNRLFHIQFNILVQLIKYPQNSFLCLFLWLLLVG